MGLIDFFNDGDKKLQTSVFATGSEYYAGERIAFDVFAKWIRPECIDEHISIPIKELKDFCLSNIKIHEYRSNRGYGPFINRRNWKKTYIESNPIKIAIIKDNIFVGIFPISEVFFPLYSTWGDSITKKNLSKIMSYGNREIDNG